MTSSDIRKKFLSFFESRGHKVVLSSSLIPDDPSVLLTTAGMQQFKPYFLGKADPLRDFGSENAVSIQKCFRTSDIDEVGDESHLTFFEMLGNFSFGEKSYEKFENEIKKKAITLAYDFITGEDWMKLEIDYVTVFDNKKVPDKDWRKHGPSFDQSTYQHWLDIFKEKEGLSEKDVIEQKKIRLSGVDNFWGPTGSEGPCGPTTEIYINDVEIWNIVFNQFYCNTDKTLEEPKAYGIDTGMGLERLTMVTQGAKNIFETDLFSPAMEILPKDIDEKIKRVFADHSRSICFLISDGVRPSNKEAGYVLRRLIRRLIAYHSEADIKKLFEIVVEEYGGFYKELNLEIIKQIFDEENSKFSKTVSNGLKELNKIESVDAKSAFKLFESFGLPYETIKEIGGIKASKLNREEFDEEFKNHQEISRAGMEKKFGGHGLILNTGELKAGSEEETNKVLRLHTATHLLQRALREVLGPEVKQAGSDITPERTRFDFSFPRKMTPEEIQKVEDLVNGKIKEDLPVNFKEMPKSEAEKTGALYFFREKYPDKVKVYYVGKSIESAWSKEFCGGPHVKNTGEIGRFKISKEESVGAGTRRIRGIVN